MLLHRQLNTIAIQRLHNHRITAPAPSQPEQLVAWFGAVQAQEYRAAKWGLGLRMPAGTTDADIESALNDGRILRTHIMRPTWHFVTAADIRWMLDLTAPRVQQASQYAYRQFELNEAIRKRAAVLIEQALRDGQSLTRAEVGAALARGRIAATGVRLSLLTIYAELEGVICSGPKRDKQQTYMLLAIRASSAKRLPRDEALAELTRRYYRSHAPATVRDFVWWSGLPTTDARRGLAASGARSETIDGRSYWTYEDVEPRRARARGAQLLPIYDEYVVAYRDHYAVPRPTPMQGGVPQAVIVGGQIGGTWKEVRTADGLAIAVTTQRKQTAGERQLLTTAAARYGRFFGVKKGAVPLFREASGRKP